MTVKLAICVLTKGYKRLIGYSALVNRTKSILARVLPTCNSSRILVDLLVFHEGNISSDHQNYIRRKLQTPTLKFVNISSDFRVPAFRPVAKELISTELSESFTAGYKNMCRFWFCGFLPYLKYYDYVCRIDEDCLVTSMNLADIIKDMEIEQAFYKTGSFILMDNPDVTIGLEYHINKFCQNINIEKRSDILLGVPSTNLFILNLNHLRSCDIFYKFAEYIDKSGGIYACRWGDAPLWGGYLSLKNVSKTSSIDTRISYFHGSGSPLTDFYYINHENSKSIAARALRRTAEALVRISHKV